MPAHENKLLEELIMFLKADKLTKEQFIPVYGDLINLNVKRLILDTVGNDFLIEIVSFYLNLLETSAAVYEDNGDYAVGIFSSGWCRYLDSASRALCNTSDNKVALESGKWLCHESCWTDASKKSIETGQTVDIRCHGCLNIYAVPIWAEKEIIGSLNMGYGNPPTNLDEIKKIAELYHVDSNKLHELAKAYQARPSLIIEIAKARLIHSAKLIGAVVAQRLKFEKLQNEFMSLLSHELRTPIAIMIQSISNLKNYKTRISEDQNRSLLDTISRNAYLVNELIDDLYLVTSIEHIKENIKFQKYSPYKIFQNILKLIEPLHKAKNITINNRIDKNLHLYGDSRRISQIFQILMNNAIKYSPKNTEIKINSQDHYQGKYNPTNLDGILFRFKDNGLGIGEEDLPHIFQPFFRSKDVLNIPGSGLGLTIAQNLVKIHQGAIFVESTLGKGTEFFIFLPRITNPP